MEMLAAFNKDGFEITVEDLHCGNPKTVITRAHFARALFKTGVCVLCRSGVPEIL